MDRRGFLKLFGGVTGGVIATATMAEAGALAEFLSWVQRSPSWSFASPLSAKEKSIREFIRMSQIVHDGQRRPFDMTHLAATVLPDFSHKAFVGYDVMRPPLYRRGIRVHF
jgi:hypothetical protein